MAGIFKKIALGLAFSPRVEALLAECAQLKARWEAELLLIHVGSHGAAEEEKLEQLLLKVNLTRKDVKVFWQKGTPSEQIVNTCKKEGVDLLVAGALKKENLLQHYIGTVARKILRKANCSVLMYITPSSKPQPLKSIVVDAQESPHLKQIMDAAYAFASQDTWIHAAHELKFLTYTMYNQYTETEYEAVRRKWIREALDKTQQLIDEASAERHKLNVKLLSGRSGFELAKFAVRKKADLLVFSAPPKRFSIFDRVFTHDQEYIFADLPSNILMVHPGKGGTLE